MGTDKNLLTVHINKYRYAYLLVGLTAVLNLHVWIDLARDWLQNDNYSHGFLVIPVAIYIIYSRRKEFVWPVKSDSPALTLIVLGSLGMIAGIAAGEYFLTRAALALQLTGIGLAALGRENFRKVWFAFAFLIFMIPIPNVVYYKATLPMQLLATKATTLLLELFGVPAAREGNIIYLPDYALEVIEACSGLRSLVALLALGSLYAWLYIKGPLRSTILVLATIPIAMAANVFRIFVTAVGAHAISKDLADSFLHEMSGMLVFISAAVMMLITGAILRWTSRNSS